MDEKHDKQPSLRTRLLDLQPLDGPGRLACEQELARLFEHRLGRAERLRYLVTACFALAMALGLASLALTEPDSTPRATRALLLGMALVPAWWFAICWRILARGSVDLLCDRRRIATTALLYTFAQCAWFGWRTLEDPAQGEGLVVFVLLLVLALGVFVRQRRRESAARRRERELRARLG